MTNENTTAKTTTTDLPAPNGHGASNGTPHGEALKTDAVPESAAKDAPPSSKKKKKKKRNHQHGKDAPPAQTKTTATPTTDAAPAAAPEQDAPTEPIEATAEAPIEATAAEAPTAEAPTAEAPIEATDAEAPTAEAPIEATAEAPIEPIEATAPAEAPIEAPTESLRLRMKVWTDPTTAKRYLMPMAQMRDVVNGQPVSDVMYVYAMREGDPTKLVTLRIAEWNTLPFFYFQEDGPAPRATERPFDVVEGLRGKIP